MKMKAPIATLVKSCALATAMAVYGVSAYAAPVPYENSGTQNLIEYTFTAAADGDIVAYFVSKGDADYSNTLSVSINGVSTGISGLNNQTSVYGQSLNFGPASAGDVVVFSIYVADLDRYWSSDRSENIDGINHVFSAAYAGDEFIPAGLYVAFEDLKGFDSDFNYLDIQFVVSNVTNGTTPEVPVPAAAWLFGTGLVGLAGVARRRRS